MISPSHGYLCVPHLVIHLRDVVEEGKVLILHLHEVGDDLVEARLLADNVSDSLESALVLGDIRVHLIHRLVGSSLMNIARMSIGKWRETKDYLQGTNWKK